MLHLSPVNAVETCYYRLMLFFPRQTLGFEQIQRLRCITAFTVLFISLDPCWTHLQTCLKGFFFSFCCSRHWPPTQTLHSPRAAWEAGTQSSHHGCPLSQQEHESLLQLHPPLSVVSVYLGYLCIVCFYLVLQTIHVYCMCHSSED